MSDNTTTEQVSKPELWNPNAAANWSVLFTPAFGAFLHAKNAERLGRESEAVVNTRWFYGMLVYLALALVSSIIPIIPEWVFRLAGLVVVLWWYFSLGKKQAAYVKETYGSDYKKRHWGRPLSIAFGCFFALMTIAYVFSLIAEKIFGIVPV
jgi:hypothetical protein